MTARKGADAQYLHIIVRAPIGQPVQRPLRLYTYQIFLLAVSLLSLTAAGGGGGGGLLPVLKSAVSSGGGYAGGAVSGGQFSSYGPDFNPLLMGGNKGYPGLRARINQRAFQYASSVIAPLLNSEIQKARLPPISQCIPQVNGCIQIYNLYVSRYRCPQRISIYPAPPNRLAVAVENLDIGVTGNLGGQIQILLPIALFGIVQANLHQVSIYVDLIIERTATGAPYIRMGSCNVQIGYADVCIQNGGLIGDIVNSQFRGRISSMVKEMAPGKICAQLPAIVNEKLNGKLSSLPQTIALTQMASMFGSALGLGGSGGGPSAEYCQASCAKSPVVLPSVSSTSSGSAPAPVSAPAPSGIVGSAPLAYRDGPVVKVKKVAARAIPVYKTGVQRQ
ncbi:unnamed protein product, partial [Mesorhabditis spiculigera]